MDRSGYEQLDRIESLLEQIAESLDLNAEEDFEDLEEVEEDNETNSEEILD